MRPKIIGITGGIGSGKSAASEIFIKKGIPVFNSDIEAKHCISDSKAVQDEICKIFGSDAIQKDPFFYNTELIKTKIKDNPELKDKLNAIVHPAVANYFEAWVQSNKAKAYVGKETALLFELGLNKKVDISLLITAKTEIRLQRYLSRPNSDPNYFNYILSQQWEDEQKRKLANYCIENNGSLKDLEENIERFISNYCT